MVTVLLPSYTHNLFSDIDFTELLNTFREKSSIKDTKEVEKLLNNAIWYCQQNCSNKRVLAD